MNFNIQLKDREISFDSGEDLDNFDLSALLKIDYSDIQEEISCFHFVLNK